MVDLRVAKAADILVNYSTKVKAGERVIINCSYDAKPLVLEVYRLCLKNKAFPKIKCGLDGEAYMFYKNANEEQLKYFPEEEFFEVQKADVVMYISGSSNTKELSSIDPSKISLRRKALEKIQKWRVEKTRWVLYNYPSSGLAQDAEMSMSEFEDFTFSATNVDYAKMSKWQDKLKKVMDEGSEVHIVGPETDLTLSIKGRTAIKGCGSHNVPDGEVFIAPDEFSAEGHIYYDVTAVYGGKEVSGVRIWFSKGKVVKATAEKNESLLHKMIAMDEGSCRLGELGVGTNFEIKRPIKQILFDEKIGGSVHLALGSAYKEGGGRNESGLHWDMIKDLRKGGSLSVDGKIIQKDGKFKI